MGGGADHQELSKTKKKKKKKVYSPSGNRTLVYRVTGGDTNHYTKEDDLIRRRY